MKIKASLSDKILIILFFFTTLLIFLTALLLEVSHETLIVLSYVFYVVGFLIAYTISHSFSKRIVNLTYKIEEIAAGNLSRKIDSKSKDEIGQLINAVNTLTGRLMLGVTQDVSRHRQLAQAKTDFIAIASHQLRTPLSITKWYIDFLLGGDAGDVSEEQKHYLEEVYISNERLIELVNNLLDVSRIDVGTFSIEPEQTDIIERAETAIKRVKNDLEKKNITLKKEFDVFPKINLDQRLTKFIFESILSNAIKYTPAKGTILFSIKKTDNNIFIKIADSGIGIPRSEQPKIFTKFFRAHNVKKIEAGGNGLGLYIVKAAIEKSGGKIWFQSPSLDLLFAPGEKGNKVPINKRNLGTTFFITIPLKGMRTKHGTKKLSSIK